jgi:hypothetical protein
MRSLFALLYRFLERGPDFLSPFKTRQKTEVEVFTLNVVTPPEPTEGFIPNDWNTNESRRTGVIHPDMVLRYIERYLDYPVPRTRYTEKDADIVYGGVRRIKLMLDGKTRMELDLVPVETERQRVALDLEKMGDPPKQVQTTTISSSEQAKTIATTIASTTKAAKKRRKFDCFCSCGRKSDTK